MIVLWHISDDIVACRHSRQLYASVTMPCVVQTTLLCRNKCIRTNICIQLKYDNSWHQDDFVIEERRFCDKNGSNTSTCFSQQNVFQWKKPDKYLTYYKKTLTCASNLEQSVMVWKHVQYKKNYFRKLTHFAKKKPHKLSIQTNLSTSLNIHFGFKGLKLWKIWHFKYRLQMCGKVYFYSFLPNYLIFFFCFVLTYTMFSNSISLKVK